MQSAHTRFSPLPAIMKLIQLSGLCTFCFITGSAFMVSQPRSASHVIRSAGDYVPAEGEGKINLKIDLESPKVVTNQEMESGKKVFCRCWLSGTFPLCDGTHAKHNDALGDNVGPLIVSVKKE